MIIYQESGIINHPRSQKIRDKFPKAKIITIEKYSDVFNRPKQDFRAQKQMGMRIILAKKREHFIHKVPECTTLVNEHNYYFAHLYNCPYDCEYCYLQGMYNSAFLVVFVNYEDFFDEIKRLRLSTPCEEKITIFTGYDSDSLAGENITGFIEDSYKLMSENENTEFELRTKSKNIEVLSHKSPLKNIFITFTISPSNITEQYEKGTASLVQRLECIEKLIKQGWRVKIRFEPLIYSDMWENDKDELFDTFKKYPLVTHVEEIGIGLLRFPKGHFKAMKKKLPTSKILAEDFENTKGVMSYPEEIEKKMTSEYTNTSKKYFGKTKVLWREN